MADPALSWMTSLYEIENGTGQPVSLAATGAVQLTVGTTGKPGRQFRVNCTVTGNVTVVLLDGSSDTFAVPVGLTVLNLAVTQVSSATATATYANWL